MSEVRITHDGLEQMRLSGMSAVTGDAIRLTHVGGGMFSAAIWSGGSPVAIVDQVYVGTADVLILSGVRIELGVKALY